VECFRFHQLNFELTPDEQSIFVSGMVEDKMTGEPIEGATVEATNCVDVAEDVTDLDGAYAIELSFAPNCTTWVCASAEGYNMACDSVWVPKGDTALIDFQLRRTPNSRLLLYYGNGGWDDGTNYTHLAEFFEEEFGLIVDYTDQWPGEFDWTSTYKLIVLLAPGHDSGDDLMVDGFTWQQKAELDSYLQQGGFLVVLSDATSFTGQAVENDLLADLPVDLQFGVNGGNFTDGFGDQITSHCLTTNVFTYSAIDVNDDWTDVDDPNGMADPGALILQNASGPGADLPMYMADVPSHGNGLVIILGDVHGLSDATYGPADFNWPGDNEWVARNWILCDP
jgi:hypothetical protein